MGNRAKLAKAAIPYSELPYTGQPSDTETVTIGSDVYEFCTDAGSVAADTRIGVVIAGSADATAQNLVDAINAKNKTNQHPTLFRVDGTTPARANGSEKFRAVLESSGNIIYLYAADKAGGLTLTEGSAPNKALTDAATNVGPWKHLNVNLSVGGATAAMTQSADLVHTVAAANLTAAQPLKIPLPFAPKGAIVQVRNSAGELKPDVYCAVTVPTAVNGQNFLGLTLKPAAPTAMKRVAFTATIKNNDTAISTLALGRDIDIHAISWACGEDPAATLTVTIAKVTASDASGSTALTTTEDIAGGTQNGKVTALGLNQAGGDIPIDVTSAQALLFSIIAGNGVTDPVQVTFFVDYIEKAVATDVIHLHVAG